MNINYESENSDSDDEIFNKNNKLIIKPSSTYFNDSSSDDDSEVDFEGGALSDKDIEEGEIEEGEIDENEISKDINDENNDIEENDDIEDDKDDEDNEDVDEENEDEDFANDKEKKNVASTKTNKTQKTKTNNKTIQLPINDDYDDEDEDEDEEYNESYLQKFNNEVSKNYINEYHPECFIHNYDEISKLTTVVRDSFGIIIDPLHKTIPYLTKYEKARVLGQRAKQIEYNSKPFVTVPENIVDGYVIAELELQQKKIPFIIRRPLPNGSCEYWNIQDLEIISF
jgi:DNA-directed RNA polymerase I, II, and III subunit RPABC2